MAEPEHTPYREAALSAAFMLMAAIVFFCALPYIENIASSLVMDICIPLSALLFFLIAKRHLKLGFESDNAIVRLVVLINIVLAAEVFAIDTLISLQFLEVISWEWSEAAPINFVVNYTVLICSLIGAQVMVHKSSANMAGYIFTTPVVVLNYMGEIELRWNFEELSDVELAFGIGAVVLTFMLTGMNSKPTETSSKRKLSKDKQRLVENLKGYQKHPNFNYEVRQVSPVDHPLFYETARKKLLNVYTNDND